MEKCSIHAPREHHLQVFPSPGCRAPLASRRQGSAVSNASPCTGATEDPTSRRSSFGTRVFGVKVVYNTDAKQNMPNDTATGRPSIYRIQVLERAFRILDILAEDRGGTALSDISVSLDLHKSTVHRLLMVLESAHFVERNAVTGKYHLGSRIMELGLSAVSQLDVYDVAQPHLRSLVEETGETAHLAVLREGEVVSLSDVESRQTVRTPRTAGSRSPAHCTALGKALLAFCPAEQLQDFFRGRTFKAYTHKTLTTAAQLRARAIPGSANAVTPPMTKSSSAAFAAWERRCATAAVR